MNIDFNSMFLFFIGIGIIIGIVLFSGIMIINKIVFGDSCVKIEKCVKYSEKTGKCLVGVGENNETVYYK